MCWAECWTLLTTQFTRLIYFWLQIFQTPFHTVFLFQETFSRYQCARLLGTFILKWFNGCVSAALLSAVRCRIMPGNYQEVSVWLSTSLYLLSESMLSSYYIRNHVKSFKRDLSKTVRTTEKKRKQNREKWLSKHKWFEYSVEPWLCVTRQYLLADSYNNRAPAKVWSPTVEHCDWRTLRLTAFICLA